MEPDGGTALALFRINRFAVSRGEDRLIAHKLHATSKTRRMVAGCCNSAMFLAFDSSQHWVSTLCNRFVGSEPKIEFRLMTTYRTSTLPYPDAAPTYPKFPVRFLGRVLRDWLAMKLGR